MNLTTNEATFLLVDDDQISIVNKTLIARDGQEALDTLRDSIDTATGKLPPFIVTLDLNMPRMSGLEFLDAVRADPQLQRLVVFVFTTSDMPHDISSAYGRNVAGYLVKDNPSETFSAALEMLGTYSRIVELPA